MSNKIERSLVVITLSVLVLVMIMLVPAAFVEAATDHGAWDNATITWRQDKLKGYSTGYFVPHRYIFDVSDLNNFGTNDIIFLFEGDRLQDANAYGYINARHFYIVEYDYEPSGSAPFNNPPLPFVFDESDGVYEVTQGIADDKYFVEFKVTAKAALIDEFNGGQLAFYWEYQLSADADLWKGNLQSRVNIPGVGAQTINFNAKRDIVQEEPSIHISKTALPTTYDSVGDLITYTIEVTNNGTVTLSDVVVLDLEADFTGSGTHPTPTFVSSTGGSLVGTLLQDESATYTATYTITQADLNTGSVYNKVTATGKTSTEGNVSASDDETVTAVQNAKIELTKTASPETYTAAGQIITYSFTVSNTGNVTLTNITITDPKVTVVGGPIASLAPDTTNSTTFTATYTITTADVSAGQVVNPATVSGSPPVGEKVTATGTKTVEFRRVPDYVPPTFTPSITVKKYVSIEGGSWLDAETAPGPSAVVGNMVRFRFVVTNNGNVTLNNVTLTDNRFGLTGATIPASLAPGGTFEYILTGITALAGQHSNTATATGTFGQQVISDTDKGHYFGAVTFTPSPSISVKKHVSVDNGATWWDAETTAAGPNAVAGAKVKFRFKVTNTGNVTLTNITLTDSKYSLSGVTVPATLAPGASFEGTIEVAAVKDRHVNTATVTGRHEGQTYSDTDKANYYGHEPYTPPVTPDPVEPKPEPEKPKPTPPTDGNYTSGLYYALVLFILAAIILKKGLLPGITTTRLNKKH